MFPFQTLRTILGGQSAIDIDRLQVRDLEQAEAFLDSYGYPWNDPDERDAIEALRRTALGFIRDELLDPGESIPPSILQQADVRQLLVDVSAPRPSPWACALLRVMHTLAHASSDFSIRFADQIEAQVLGRFAQRVRRDSTGLWLGEVPLVHYEARARKPLPSVVLKLLHKPANVAADIFDRLGVRFVTANRLDALLVVRYLRAEHIIMFANIKPRRSKNSLVDLDQLEAAAARIDDPEALAAEIESWPYPEPGPDPANPYSSRSYHAIQFTARQRVRVTDKHGDSFRFFFPFEIQILDKASYIEGRRGFASHVEYKARQRAAARQRVLRGI